MLATVRIDKNKIYRYFDPLTIAGNISYRIKAVDYDGQTTHSETIIVTQRKLNELKVYPSIITDGKLMVSSSDADARLDVQLYNLNGGMIASQMVYANTVDVSSFGKGMYIVKVNDGSQRLVTKRIIIN